MLPVIWQSVIVSVLPKPECVRRLRRAANCQKIRASASNCQIFVYEKSLKTGDWRKRNGLRRVKERRREDDFIAARRICRRNRFAEAAILVT